MSSQSSSPPPGSAPPSTGPEAVARAFLVELAGGRAAEAATRFDPAMAAAMPAEVLAKVWADLEDAGGRFDGVEAARVEPRGAYRVVLVTTRFSALRKILRITVDAGGKIGGFFQGPVPEDLEQATRAFIEKLSGGDLAGAAAGFDPTMAAALPPEALAAHWGQLVGQVGAFGGIESARMTTEGGHWIVYAACRFAATGLVVKAVYDARNRVSGLFFLPPGSDPTAEWTPPSYAQPDRFTERAVSVGTAPALPGKLTVPAGAGPFPAVVLIHGSGPSDEDESQGPNRTFKDLAWGLASRGIVVLRYVKRTRHAPAGVVTVKDEVNEAAHQAVAVLRATPEVDAGRVVVVGHSQGGYMAPWIARDDPGVAAIVVLAGTTRPIPDVVIDQAMFFAGREPGNAVAQQKVEEARAFKQVVEDPALGPEQDVVFPFGGKSPGAYWISLRGYDPAMAAARLPIPILALHGTRDYQVTEPDFAGWKRALSGKAGARLVEYPGLNHHFMPGSGPPGPEEYLVRNHVDAQVVEDIAAFVNGLPCPVPEQKP